MDQDRIAPFHRITLTEEIPCSHSSKHHGGSLPEGDLLGKFYKATGRYQPYVRIGTGRDPSICNTVTGFKFSHVFADCFHHTRAFHPRCRRQGGQWIKPGAMININKVNPDCFVPNQHFTLARPAGIVCFPTQNFGPTGFIHSDCFCHVTSCLPFFSSFTLRTAPPIWSPSRFLQQCNAVLWTDNRRCLRAQVRRNHLRFSTTQHHPEYI